MSYLFFFIIYYTRPFKISEIETKGGADIELFKNTDNMLILSDMNSGITIINVTNRENPVIVSHVKTGGTAVAISLSSDD